MLYNFPLGLPDELLYSQCARFRDRMQFPSDRDVIVEIFGDRNVTAIVDLPSHLDHFVASLPPEHAISIDEVIWHNTLFPLYGAFLPPARQHTLQKDMCGAHGPAIHMRAGLMASRVRLLEQFRLCQRCVEQDRQHFGEAYWHRTAQCPGVVLCPVHGDPLVITDVRTRQRTPRYSLISAEQAAKQAEHHQLAFLSKYYSILCQIAQDTAWMLSQTSFHLSPDQFQGIYRDYLIDRGYALYSQRTRLHKLCRDIETHYSSELLAFLGCPLVRDSEDNWVARLIRRSPNHVHPLYHLLFIQFLGATAEQVFTSLPRMEAPFGSGPWPCLNPACQQYRERCIRTCEVVYSPYAGRPMGTFSCHCGFIYTRTGPDQSPEDHYRRSRISAFGSIWHATLQTLWNDPAVSLRQTAYCLGVDPATVKRQIDQLSRYSHEQTADYQHTPEWIARCENYREQWLAACANHPLDSSTQLRQKLPAVYTWLYRHDREWLTAHKPMAVKGTPPVVYVDWEERDRMLAHQVRIAAIDLQALGKRPKRISASAISRHIRAEAVIQQHRKKLPLTWQTLTGLAESRCDFALRRITWATSCYAREEYIPQRWELIRRAGVSRLITVSKIRQHLDEALMSFHSQVEDRE